MPSVYCEIELSRTFDALGQIGYYYYYCYCYYYYSSMKRMNASYIKSYIKSNYATYAL